jgi:hypothetical protein
MHTSYFAKSGSHPNAVSIAGKAPKWYKGREYKKLAPKFWFFKKYKKDGDKQFYTEQFYRLILNHLDPQKVIEDLGPHAIILCYEKPGDFCHRHIVAQWLHDKLGVTIKEL